MSNNYAKTLAAIISKAKLAAEMPPEVEAAHEAAESPGQEAMEHQPGQYEEGGEGNPETAEHEMLETAPQESAEHALGGEEAAGEGMGEGMGEEHIDQLLSQLSPEELEQLATELSGEMQNPEATAGSEDVGELAQAIQANLDQNPEASLEGVAPEKAAALNFVKSAAYIEGFINQAVDKGIAIKQAVDMYDQALTSTINSLKAAELKGNQTKLDVDHDGKIEASDLAKLRAGKKQKTAFELNEEIKTAAYYEGIIERAREYGFSDQEAVHFVKSAFMSNPATGNKSTAPGQPKALNASNSKKRSSKKDKDSLLRDVKAMAHRGGRFAKRNAGKLGLGAAAGALGAYALSGDKE